MAVLESLLTVPQAAKLAAVSPRTMQRLILTGRAPQVVRVGRSVRLRTSEVDRWIRAGCPCWAECQEGDSSEN